MWLVLENHRRSGEHDVGEQDVFRVQPHRAVHRGNQRHLNIEDVHQNFFAFTVDLVVTPRGKEIEAVGCDRFHEGAAATSKDYHAIVGIGADSVKQVDELLVRVPVEHQYTAIGVKRDFQHTTLRPREVGVGKTVAILVKADHGYPPYCRRH